MEENQGKKIIPDLGEGIKPEDVVFSSQNIIGGSVAGSDKKFFGRVKKEVSLKDRINEQLKKNQTTNRSRLQKLLQNKKFWIITAISLVLIALILGVVFFISRSRSGADSTESVTEDIYIGDEEFGSEEDDNSAAEAPIIEDIPENIKSVDPGTDPSATGPVDVAWLDQKLRYIQDLIDNGFFLTTGYEFESLIQDVEDYSDRYSNCQKAAIYRTMGKLYEIRGDTSEEAINSNSELINQYQGLCDGAANQEGN